MEKERERPTEKHSQTESRRNGGVGVGKRGERLVH